MPFGLITTEMQTLVAEVVRGKTVYDLGAGDLCYTRMLTRLGANMVVAVDKDLPRGAKAPKGAQLRRTTFCTLVDVEDIEVAFLCWPANYPMPGLLRLLHRAQTIVYIGSNFDGTACGWPALFEYFLHRQLLGQIDTRTNSLLLLGGTISTAREPTREEAVAISGELVRFGD